MQTTPSLVQPPSDPFAQTEYLNWIDLLDMNVWIIIILMFAVSGFTMISGLLIIILERTNMIGILKSMGARDFSIRKVFLYLSAFLIGQGMFWGNVIGLSICFIQKYFQLIKLDPVTYYLSAVPIDLNLWNILLINIGTLAVSLLMMIDEDNDEEDDDDYEEVPVGNENHQRLPDYLRLVPDTPPQPPDQTR